MSPPWQSYSAKGGQCGSTLGAHENATGKKYESLFLAWGHRTTRKPWVGPRAAAHAKLVGTPTLAPKWLSWSRCKSTDREDLKQSWSDKTNPDMHTNQAFKAQSKAADCCCARSVLERFLSCTMRCSPLLRQNWNHVAIRIGISGWYESLVFCKPLQAAL